MKISDIIQKVKINDKNKEHSGWDALAECFDLNYCYDWDKFTEKVTCYFFAKWYCTDTYVGGRVYYLGNTPIAVSWQSARKSDEIVQFLSIEKAKKLKDFMITCIEPEEDHVNLVDIEKDLKNGYQISYGAQILKKDCTHIPTGTKANIIKTFSKMNEIDKWKEVEIELGGSKEKHNVLMEDLLFEYGD